ncbi:MAG: hypothetical protein IJ347_02765 [Faecalibacterium sp.]|nr:hypothetical protein [Faecalibacterium sp.]
MKIFAKRPRALIPLVCYGLAAVVWFLLCTGQLALDGVARLQGRMPQVHAPLAEFELYALEATGEDSLVSTTPDPQLYWYNPDGRVVRSVQLQITFPRIPGELALYYTEQPGEAFGRDRKVYPIQQADDSWLFVLPRAQVYSLRIDPSSEIITMNDVQIQFNTGYRWWQYYLPGWQQAFDLLLFPGLAASALNILAEALRCRKAQKKG